MQSDRLPPSGVGIGERAVEAVRRHRYLGLAALGLLVLAAGEVWGRWQERSHSPAECAVVSAKVEGRTEARSSVDANGETVWRGEYVEYTALELTYRAGDRQGKARIETAERAFRPGQSLQCWLGARDTVTLVSPRAEAAQIRTRATILAACLLAVAIGGAVLQRSQRRRRSNPR